MPPREEEMKANALEAMKLTRKHFVSELDFSESSVEELETLFDQVRFAWPGGNSPETIEQLTQLWGAYLGEVIRRHCGGQWIEREGGAVALQGEKTTLYPHDKVRKRLLNGPKENIWEYYQAARELRAGD
jgi:hypothetical protein